MTQYFYLDESGDAGLEGQTSSSSHFVLAMVQLPERAWLRPLVNLRKNLHLAPDFEYKYHKTTTLQKERFFKDVMGVEFRVRAVAVDKTRLTPEFKRFLPQVLTIELIIGLTMRASELDIANHRWRDSILLPRSTRPILRTK